MKEEVEVLFRPATPPDDPSVKYRGFKPGRTILETGSTYSENGRKLSCDIVFDRDVDMPLRDGTRIYLDVFRPVTDEPLPAVLAWSPYGKQADYWSYDNWPGRAGVAQSATSGLEKFEGPDPAFFCANGYAIVNVDPRGCFESEGDSQFWSATEIQDACDVIEWIAAQEWCSGAVATSGNSWLGISQFKIAAARPPHLAAIAPWEGFTDAYRDFVRWGGIPRLDLVETIAQHNAGRGQIEDMPAMTMKYPLMNGYWRSKITDIEAIDVPAYVVSGWTNPLHTRGTLDAFTRMDPSRTWLRVHNTYEWPDLYEHEGDLLRFYDHVIKGKDNGWEQTPRVRLSVLDPGGKDIVGRPEENYPLARAVETVLYLDGNSLGISTRPPAAEGRAEYETLEGSAVFDYVAEEDFEIVGPMKLRLWLEVDGGDNADLFVYVRKADAEGKPLLATLFPGTQVPAPGAVGRIRASHRELDEEKSTALVPVLRHERELPLEPGTPVALDIPIWPHGMAWHAGQRLQVVVSGRELGGATPYPKVEVGEERRAATSRIRTGGSFDSHLLVPMVK